MITDLRKLFFCINVFIDFQEKIRVIVKKKKEAEKAEYITSKKKSKGSLDFIWVRPWD